MQREREIDRFQVKSQDGTIYDVIEYQEYSELRTINGEWLRTDGFKRFDLQDGGHLNRIDDDNFKIVATDEIVRRVPTIGRGTRTPTRRNRSGMAA